MFSEFLANLDWTEIIVAVTGTVGTSAAVWYRKKINSWIDFWSGVLDGLRGIPNLQTDVKGLQTDVRGIRYYVAPNGGGSMMDAMTRTEQAVTGLGEQLELVVQTMWAENDSDDDVGRFHSNSDGANTYVNQLYARWLGVGKTELMGWNFMNFVHPTDADRVRNHWALCRAEHRQYRIRMQMVDAEGKAFEVEVVATPIPEASPAKRWIGSIRRIGYDRRKEEA